jgi:hypothetical protein
LAVVAIVVFVFDIVVIAVFDIVIVAMFVMFDTVVIIVFDTIVVNANIVTVVVTIPSWRSQSVCWEVLCWVLILWFARLGLPMSSFPTAVLSFPPPSKLELPTSL